MGLAAACYKAQHKHQLSTAEPPSPQDYRHRGPGSSHSPPPRHHKYQLDISRCLGVPRCGSVAEGTGQAFDFTVPTFRCAGDAAACSLRPKSNSCSSEGPLKKAMVCVRVASLDCFLQHRSSRCATPARHYTLPGCLEALQIVRRNNDFIAPS